jgi:hypothetical protein
MLSGLLIVAVSPIGAGASDSCTAKVPTALATAVATAFPKHRLPLASDNSTEDVGFDIKEGGDGCLRIASGDFDGNGESDFAFILMPRKEGTASLVVALVRKTHFDFKNLREWGSPEHLYVTRVRPGIYKRTEALDGPPSETGEVIETESKLPGIASGSIESSRVVYFLKAGKWIHIWISD